MACSARARRTGVLAWPLASVRAHESLWSLVHRFLWLNAPSWGDLERSFGCPCLKPFSLIDGLRTRSAHDHDRPAFDRSRLSVALGLPARRWDSGTLAWLRDTPVDDVIFDLRFCRECLQLGYHTVVFQMACVATCPIHGAILVRGCPVCGQPISAQLDRAALDKPYACGRCGHRLAPGASLVNPPPIEGRGLSSIVAWYRRLCALAIVAPQPGVAGTNPPAFAPSWRHACLEVLGGYPAPASIHIRREEVRAGRAARARCGLRLTRKERWHSGSGAELSRHTLIYKAYRRHVQKTLPRGTRQLMLAYVDGHRSLWIAASSALERDRRAAAYALLLFRSRMERWADLFEYGNAALSRRHARAHEFSARSLSCARFRARECPPNSVEGRWLLDHLYYEELRAHFQEALHQARCMATIGSYGLSQDVPWGANLPYALGVGQCGRVEFRSWGEAERPALGGA